MTTLAVLAALDPTRLAGAMCGPRTMGEALARELRVAQMGRMN